MTDITPPPELVEQWRNEWIYRAPGDNDELGFLALRGAQWGADQELEACCEWLASARNHTLTWNEATNYSANLRAARRPKPPSLKEQALAALLHLDQGQHNERCLLIRQALEQLDEGY